MRNTMKDDQVSGKLSNDDKVWTHQDQLTEVGVGMRWGWGGWGWGWGMGLVWGRSGEEVEQVGQVHQESAGLSQNAACCKLFIPVRNRRSSPPISPSDELACPKHACQSTALTSTGVESPPSQQRHACQLLPAPMVHALSCLAAPLHPALLHLAP